jgi:hypothetical protein
VDETYLGCDTVSAAVGGPRSGDDTGDVSPVAEVVVRLRPLVDEVAPTARYRGQFVVRADGDATVEHRDGRPVSPGAESRPRGRDVDSCKRPGNRRVGRL